MKGNGNQFKHNRRDFGKLETIPIDPESISI